MIRSICTIMITTVYFMCSTSASAQAPALTVAAVKTALEDILKKFNTTIETAGSEVRSTGASLSANAQNVITDLDTQLGKRMTDTVDQLNDVQKQIINNAIILTQQIDKSTNDIIRNTGSEARRAIFEADITAYNTSFSIPCRDQTPRIVYYYPDTFRRNTSDRQMHIRGNFLDIGEAKTLKVGNIETKIISRSRGEIVFDIPEKLLAASDSTESISIVLPVSMQKQTNLWLYCYSREEKYRDLSAAVMIRPQLNFKISGSINGTYDSIAPWSNTFSYNRSDNDCDASFDDNKQYCAPAGFVLDASKGISINRKSANCNSSIGSPVIAGNRCVMVPAHLGGCGYDNFYLAKNCKGRGFFDYDVTISASQSVPVANKQFDFLLSSTNGQQRSFEAIHPDGSKNLPNQRWSYTLDTHVREGENIIETITATDANPNPQGISSGVANGRVFINVSR